MDHWRNIAIAVTRRRGQALGTKLGTVGSDAKEPLERFGFGSAVGVLTESIALGPDAGAKSRDHSFVQICQTAGSLSELAQTFESPARAWRSVALLWRDTQDYTVAPK